MNATSHFLHQRNIKDILHSYSLATHYDPAWYKAWHTWALANFEVISYTESQSENRILDKPGNELVVHIVQSVDGECWLFSNILQTIDLIL